MSVLHRNRPAQRAADRGESFAGARGGAAAQARCVPLRRRLARDSRFSAAGLAARLRRSDDRARLVARLLAAAHRHWQDDTQRDGLGALLFPRLLHTLSSAVASLAGDAQCRLGDVLPGLASALAAAETAWLEAIDLHPDAARGAAQWCERGRTVALQHLGRSIVASGGQPLAAPGAPLRSDEIVWGRSPARLDLCGGWTDTPPYALEFGGCVLNAAVNLNGQPPIQVFARVIDEPLVRVTSIDRGTRLEIARLEDLLNFRNLDQESSLVKAALTLSGLVQSCDDASPAALARQLTASCGGGIELTTLAAIPKGSGLGTSSIMGAVVLAVLDRVAGRSLDTADLFHRVLRLEQALTTGGGWQDQIGGVIDGVKLITTTPGTVPDPEIQFIPADALDPSRNDGCTLLYYTGLTRLAKNILQRVVGRCLDRDRAAMRSLRSLRALAPQAAAAMARRDLEAFGHFVDAAWQLNKQLDPDSSNAAIESLLARVGPHIHGGKLLGAGGGGFLLLICKTPADAAAVRKLLDADPPNPRARFFQFHVNHEGMRITAC
jgi:galactokinase/mevalonate kinase-like predicted kinase